MYKVQNRIEKHDFINSFHCFPVFILFSNFFLFNSNLHSKFRKKFSHTHKYNKGKGADADATLSGISSNELFFGTESLNVKSHGKKWEKIVTQAAVLRGSSQTSIT